MGGIDGQGVNCLVVIVAESDGPAARFPHREDFLRVFEETQIEDTFNQYLRVDGLGRLSYTTRKGENLSWPEFDATTSDFARFAKESRARWDLLETLKLMLTNGRKSEAAAEAAEKQRAEDYYLTDFINKFEPGGRLKLDECVLMLDERVAERYIAALKEQRISPAIYWY
jgi:hypothetical protein